jgi:hypothetical protein
MRKLTAVVLCATSAAMAWGLATISPGGSEPGIKEHRVHQPTLYFQGDQLTNLQWASDYAAWCGGEVLIDKDDAEVLIGYCDR